MAQHLRALTFLQEGLGSIPRTHMAEDNCSSSPRDPMSSSSLRRNQAHNIHAGKTPIQIKYLI